MSSKYPSTAQLWTNFCPDRILLPRVKLQELTPEEAEWDQRPSSLVFKQACQWKNKSDAFFELFFFREKKGFKESITNFHSKNENICVLIYTPTHMA